MLGKWYQRWIFIFFFLFNIKLKYFLIFRCVTFLVVTLEIKIYSSNIYIHHIRHLFISGFILLPNLHCHVCENSLELIKVANTRTLLGLCSSSRLIIFDFLEEFSHQVCKHKIKNMLQMDNRKTMKNNIIIKKYTYGADKTSLLRIYHSFIRLKVEYGSVIYSIHVILLRIRKIRFPLYFLN